MEHLIAAFGLQEWIIVLVVILVLFGGTKIPQLMRGVGRGVGELQKGLEEGKKSFERAAQPEPETQTGTAKTGDM